MNQFAVAQAPSAGGMPPARPANADRAGTDAASFTEVLGKAGRAPEDGNAGAEPNGDGSKADATDGQGAPPAKPERARGREAAADLLGAVGGEAGGSRTADIEAALKAGGAAGADAALRPDVAGQVRGVGEVDQAPVAGGRDAPAAQSRGPEAAVMAVMSYLNARSAEGGTGRAGPRAPSGPAGLEGRVPAGSGLDGLVPARGGPDKGAHIALGGAAVRTDMAAGTAFAVKGEAVAGADVGKAAKIMPAPAGKPVLPATGVSGQADGARPQSLAVPLDLGRVLAGEGDLPAPMRETVTSHVARVMAASTHGQPVPVLRIQLQPAHLGQVNVTMRLSGEQMQVTLTPDSASAARVLGSDQEAITTVLRSLGGAFAGASIDVGGETALRQGLDEGAARDAAARQGDAFHHGEHRPSGGGARGGPGDAGEPAMAAGGAASAATADGRIII